jgi:hypothetical protein
MAALGCLVLCTVGLVGLYTREGPTELMMKVHNNRRIGLMAAQRPHFVRGMMTAAQFKELLENEEKENVVKICGASTCKAGKGCNPQEFSACLSMSGLERQRFVLASLPSLNLMEGPLKDLPDSPAVTATLDSLPADTTAAQCGTKACSERGCDDKLFFSCFAEEEAAKKAFAEDYPAAVTSMTHLVADEVKQDEMYAQMFQHKVAANKAAYAKHQLAMMQPRKKGLKSAKTAALAAKLPKGAKVAMGTSALDDGILADLPDEPFLEEGPLSQYPVDTNLDGELGQYPVDTNLDGELAIYPVDTNLEGELGQYPIDTNLEGELSIYPVDTNLEGELGQYPIDTNLEGELGQYPIDTNLEGELSIYPVDTNLEGELGQYPIDTNLEGELGQYPIDTNLEGELGQYPIDTNLEGELGQFPIDTNLEGELGQFPIDTNLEGELGQFPIDTNLEGELGQFPIDTNLEGELGQFPVSTDLVGMLGGLPDEPYPEGILMGLPDDPNPEGILAGLPDEANPEGILAGLAEEKNLELGELGTLADAAHPNGILDGLRGKKAQLKSKKQLKGTKQQLNYYTDLKHNPNETPAQYQKSAGKGDKGKGHYVAQTKARKQSLLMLRRMSLAQGRQQQLARLRAARLVQMLKVEGQEVACGVVACNPDKGCDAQSFRSCLAEVKQQPIKEKELLDMHRAEVLKLVKENKQLLAVKQLSAQQCVVETCSDEGCDNSKFVTCIQHHVKTAEKATMELRLLHNKRAVMLRKILAQRRAAFAKLSPEKRAAYIEAIAQRREALLKKMSPEKRVAYLKALRAKAVAAKKHMAAKKHGGADKTADAKGTADPKKADAKKPAPKAADAKKAPVSKAAEAKKPSQKTADSKKVPAPKAADAKKKADAHKGKTAAASNPKESAEARKSNKVGAEKKAPKKADAKVVGKKGAVQGAKTAKEHGSNELLRLITGAK